MISTGRWLLGLVALAAMVIPVVVGSAAVRRRVLPDRAGAPGALATAVIGLGITYAVSLALGTVGLFRPVPIVVALGGAGCATFFRSRRAERQMRRSARRERPQLAPLAATTAVVAVAGTWVAHVVVAYDRGMLDGDTLWYHGPFAARFLQDGWITRLHFTNAEPLVTFFPANSEVAGALALVPFGADVLSPALNLGWLALALLGGWCAGRAWGSGPLGMAGTALVAGLPVMSSTQAGTGRNDIVGLALLLAAVGLVADGGWRSPAVNLAGVAAGLAVGVKVSLLAPVALVALAVLAAIPGDRRRTLWPRFALAVAVPAAYWYVRNWVRTGNPLPWFPVDIGPLSLPAPPLPEADVGDVAVVDHLSEPGVFGEVFLPGLDTAFGPLWMVVVGLALVGGALAVARGDRLARALGVAAVVAAVAYLFTPNSAAIGDPDGDPVLRLALFFLNLRYLTPALALGLVLLAAGVRTARARLALTGGVTALAVVAQVPREMQAGFEWPLPGPAVVAGFAVVAVAAVVLRAPPTRTAPHRLALAVAAVALAGLGLPLARGYLDDRYTTAAFVPLPAAGLYRWAADLDDERIALAGDFFQYPFYGGRLTNRVQYVGQRGPHGAFGDVEDCAAWQRALVTGRYDYLVIAPPAFLASSAVADALAWTEASGTARQVASAGTARAFRLEGRPDPSSCPPEGPR